MARVKYAEADQIVFGVRERNILVELVLVMGDG